MRRLFFCDSQRVLPGVAFLIAVTLAPTAAAAGGAAIVRAVSNYFGKESATEATEWLTKNGGQELAERLSAKAAAEGGEATADRVAAAALRYGPEALSGLDNVPAIRPVLNAIDELPPAQVAPAFARLGAGEQGKQLAEVTTRYGAAALRAEVKHPGVGVRYASRLGSDGIALAEKLTPNQATEIGKHIDDIAKLPPEQRSAVLQALSEQSERFTSFLGSFVRENPGKTLFSVGGTTVLLANRDAIFGGDKIVFDKDGNPVLMSTQGLLERAGSRVTTEVTDRVVSPLVQVFVPLLAALVAGFGIIKLYGVWKRQQQALATSKDSSPGL